MNAKTTAIVNIGDLVSGILDSPLLNQNAVLVGRGQIMAVGDSDDLEMKHADTRIDVNGATVAPGLIDCHQHPVFGQWTARYGIDGYVEWALQGGVTTMISAGEIYLPGRPADPAGVKALAILAHKSHSNARPSGVKVHGGAVILEPGLVEQDFRDMAAEGVWLTGEIGSGAISDPEEAAEMTRWAQSCGMKVRIHAGGPSAGSRMAITAKVIRTVKPDVVCHINGGSTAMPEEDVAETIQETDFVTELVSVGNPRIRAAFLRWLSDQDALHRLMLGVDLPGGPGVFNLGMLRNIMEITAMEGIPPAVSIALATGNTAGIYGLPTGKIEVGREADLVVLDAPLGSPAACALDALQRGDMLGVAAVMVDGELLVRRSRLTPPPKREVVVVTG
jgi:enamidase